MDFTCISPLKRQIDSTTDGYCMKMYHLRKSLTKKNLNELHIKILISCWLSVLLLFSISAITSHRPWETASTNNFNLQVRDVFLGDSVESTRVICEELWKRPVNPAKKQSAKSYLNLTYQCYIQMLKEGAFQEMDSQDQRLIASFLDALARISPGDARTRYALLSYLISLDDDHHTIHDLLSSLIEDNTLPASALGWVNYWLAETSSSNSNFDYNKAIQFNPQIIGAYYSLYEDALSQGAINEASMIAQTVSELKPTSVISSTRDRDCQYLEGVPISGMLLRGFDIEPVLLGQSPFIWVTLHWEITSAEDENDSSTYDYPFEQIVDLPSRQMYRINNRIFDVRLVHNLVPNGGFEWFVDPQSTSQNPPNFYEIWHWGVTELKTSVIPVRDVNTTEHILKIVTSGEGTWEPYLASTEFPVDPETQYIQGGTVLTDKSATKINLGRKQTPPQPGQELQPGLSWGTYQISTEAEKRTCTTLWNSWNATSANVNLAVVDFPGLTYADNLFLFKLPLPPINENK